MATDYTYLYEEYPEVISADQLYRICHISKRKAKWLLEHGYIPCEDSGKKTRRYKIRLNDVIDYLLTLEAAPERGLEPEPPAEPSPIPERPEEQARRKPEEKGVLMIVAFLIIVISVFFYLGRNNWKPAPAQEEVITEAKNTAKDTVQESAWMLHPDSVAEKTPHTEPEPYVEPAPKPLGQVKIKHVDRLTVIALEYYGNKLFWVYIYQHNKAVIKDPNNVPIGTVIEIPAPESYGIDAKSRESREKAAALQTEILAGE